MKAIVFWIHRVASNSGRKSYLNDRSGVTLVLKHYKELKVIAKNELGEQIVSSPALAGNQLFLRGRKHLYSITQEKDLN